MDDKKDGIWDYARAILWAVLLAGLFRMEPHDLVADTLVSADSVVATEGECRFRPRVAQSATHLSSREWRLPP